jgi:hypothetical protein
LKNIKKTDFNLYYYYLVCGLFSSVLITLTNPKGGRTGAWFASPDMAPMYRGWEEEVS